MMPDLQTDPSFPSFAETADPEALRMEEFMSRDNELAEHLFNYPPVEIEDRQGGRYWVLGRAVGSSAAPGPWSLEVVKASTGQVKITLGDYIADISDLTAKVEIAGDTEFTASAGHICRLKVTSIDPLTASIESGPPWEGFPAGVKVTGTGESTALEAAYWPLWQFSDEAAPGSFPIRANLHARRIAPETHLRHALSLYRDPGLGKRPVQVPLFPDHAALTPALTPA